MATNQLRLFVDPLRIGPDSLAGQLVLPPMFRPASCPGSHTEGTTAGELRRCGECDFTVDRETGFVPAHDFR